MLYHAILHQQTVQGQKRLREENIYHIIECFFFSIQVFRVDWTDILVLLNQISENNQ